MTIWQSLYNQTYLTGITSLLWQEWKDFAVRVLARERDTTFGISRGSRPQLPRRSPSAITLNPFRATRGNVNNLVSTLFVATAAQGNVPVGNRWSSGKDRDFVVIL